MLVEAEIWSIARIGQDNAVLVRPVGGELAVPIYIDQYQTQSILIGLGNVPMPRPLTHDLLISILEELNVSVERVEITSLKDGTFYAQIIIERKGKKTPIDARPSDSIALAVRLKCPIFISESIVDEAGSEISTITGEVDETVDFDEETGLKTEREVLMIEMQKAIDDENYEDAAVLRDRINELETTES